MFTHALQITWLVLTLAGLLAVIPLLVYVVILATRRQWKKIACWTLIPLGIYLPFSGLVLAVSHHHFSTTHHRIFGAKFDLGEPLFEYQSPRGFNGDGYSIRVYPLPDVVRQRFSAADRGLPQLPPTSFDRKDWQSQPWQAAPLAPEFEKHLAFTLALYDQRQNQDLLNAFSAIREALAGPSAYYAFRYYMHGDHPGNIDFYLVDLADGKIYLINHNT